MPDRSTSPAVAALVLAAGASSRMGRAKALLDWGGKPLLRHQIDELLAAGCDPVVVVLGHESLPIEEAVDRTDVCQIVINTQHMSGRASSVRVGMAVLNNAVLSGAVGAVIIASVDTPCSAATARALIDAWRAGPGRAEPTTGAPNPASIIVPRVNGKNGHPALFDRALLAALRAVTERGEGLRAVRRAHAGVTTFLNVDDPLVALNLNTPEAYESARGQAAAP